MGMIERAPLLREMTALTEGEDTRIDQLNLLAGLRYQFNYQILYDVIEALCTVLEIGTDKVSVAEGYVSRKLAKEHGFEVQDEDSFEFRNLVFGLDGAEDTEAVLTDALPKALDDAGHGRFIQSVRLDSDSGLFLMKVKKLYSDDAPVVLEMEADGEVYVLQEETGAEKAQEKGETIE